jgi:hypothetical protein
MSPCAFNAALWPALSVLPTTLISLSAWHRLQEYSGCGPADTVLPTAVLDDADELLLLWLVPIETVIPVSPGDAELPVTES